MTIHFDYCGRRKRLEIIEGWGTDLNDTDNFFLKLMMILSFLKENSQIILNKL